MTMQQIVDEFNKKMDDDKFLEGADSVTWGALRAAQEALSVANGYGEFGDE